MRITVVAEGAMKAMKSKDDTTEGRVSSLIKYFSL